MIVAMEQQQQKINLSVKNLGEEGRREGLLLK